MLKLYAFGMWDEEMRYDFVDFLVAKDLQEAQIKAEDLFCEDDVEVWEVQIDGYKIEIKEDWWKKLNSLMK